MKTCTPVFENVGRSLAHRFVQAGREGESTNNLEAVVGFDYANYAYDFPNTDIQLTTYGYFGLNQWGRVRLEANASLRRELFSDFYFGLKGYESYDSEPATEGAQKNDWGLTHARLLVLTAGPILVRTEGR